MGPSRAKLSQGCGFHGRAQLVEITEIPFYSLSQRPRGRGGRQRCQRLEIEVVVIHAARVVTDTLTNLLRHLRPALDQLFQRPAVIGRVAFQQLIEVLHVCGKVLIVVEVQRPLIQLWHLSLIHISKRTLALCKEAGVTMTDAGATFPYGKDPQDSNIRIAPSLPPVEELEQAIAVLCTCLKLSALEALGV